MSVINLNERRIQQEPHWSGEARCLACKHEWPAVAPMGVFEGIECPSCGTFRGIPKYAFAPSDGPRLECVGCGCDAYRVLTDGVMCIGCGSEMSFAELADEAG